LIIASGEAPLGMIHAPVVTGDPDDIGHTPRSIEDDEDIGLYDSANKRRDFALHRRQVRRSPEEEG